MKNIKNLVIAALAAGTVASASAGTVTYISGSTAFRSSANTALQAFATNNGGALVASDNATLTKSSYVLWNWTNAQGTNYINVHWNGSEAGIQSAAGPVSGTNAKTVNFYSTNTTGGLGGASSSLATNYAVTAIAFSDTFQSTSIFHGTVGGVSYSTLAVPTNTTSGKIGVVAFNWVASAGFPGTNMSTQIADYVLGSGNVPVALFTGNSADTNKGCYLLGRNIDSGTRLQALAIPAYGTTIPVLQYAVGTNFTMSNGIATITGTAATNSIFTYPIETINGVTSTDPGNSGYSSGGTLCSFMTNFYAVGTSLNVGVVTASNTLSIDDYSASAYTSTNFLIGYAGTSDANSYVTNSGSNNLIKLAYNGVVNSTTAIQQGQYTFWGYEHMYFGASTNANAVLVGTTVSASIQNTTTASLSPNVQLSSMVAGVLVDGGTVSPLY